MPSRCPRQHVRNVLIERTPRSRGAPTRLREWAGGGEFRNGIGDGGENIFPSIETIQEIKVSSINNPAEYPQVGDITTITKSGSNSYHGTVFWNYNGTSMNANPNYFSRSLVTTTVNNNTGASLGGRIFRDKTFFFGAFDSSPLMKRPNVRFGSGRLNRNPSSSVHA